MQIGRYLPVLLAVVAGVTVGNYTFKPLLQDEAAARRKKQFEEEEAKRNSKQPDTK